MGSLRRNQDFYEKGMVFYPRAQNLHIGQEVTDYEYVPCEEPPDLNHGIVWAHRLDASPPDLFGETLCYIDYRLEQVRLKEHRRQEVSPEVAARRAERFAAFWRKVDQRLGGTQ